MKKENIIITIIAALFYNISVIETTPLPMGLIASLLMGGVVTGIIMIFKQDKSNWSSVFMWTTIILSVLSSIGQNFS